MERQAQQMEITHVVHNFEPIYDAQSKILILGSFPSVKSRENEFYYGHPMNRFWRVLSGIYHEEVPVTIPEKKAFLLRNHVALWDVIASCDIVGSSDSSIKNVTVNDIAMIKNVAQIEAVYANGGKAYELFLKYCGKDIIKLPSTSPANAAWSLERLIETWGNLLHA